MNILDRLSNLIEVIYSTPFFIFFLGFIVFTIIAFSVYDATKSKLSKIIVSLSYLCILSFLFIKYGKFMFSLFDTFIDQLILILYFPNLFTYISMMVALSLLILITIINDRIRSFIRVSNGMLLLVVVFLCLLTLNTVNKYNIGLFDGKIIYTNEILKVLVTTGYIVIILFLGLLLINLIINLISRIFNNKENNEEIEYLSDEDYNKKYQKINKRKKYQEYINYDKN